MRREERRRKFHEALLNTLYPKSPQTQQQHTNDEHVNPSFEEINVDLIPDDYGLQLQQSDDENENDDGEKKLSRSQRKRIRKKKIKEDVDRRRIIIGPLFSSANDDQEDNLDVRPNACDEEVSSSTTTTNKLSKMKQRREAKKLAKDKLKTSFTVDNSVQNELLESSDKLESFEDLETRGQDRNSKSEDCQGDA